MSVGKGELRVIVETTTSRLATTVRLPRGVPVSASAVSQALPEAVSSIERQLQHIRDREERASDA